MGVLVRLKKLGRIYGPDVFEGDLGGSGPVVLKEDVRFRLADVEAPSLYRDACCVFEKNTARRGVEAFRSLVEAADRVDVELVERRAGRVDVDVVVDGVSLAVLLFRRRVLRPPGSKIRWCEH